MKRQQLFVVDEIGKMELLSKGFVSAVRGLFEAVQSQQVHLQSPLTLKLGLGVVVLATVPVARHGMHPLVEELKRRKDCQLFEVRTVVYVRAYDNCRTQDKNLVKTDQNHQFPV